MIYQEQDLDIGANAFDIINESAWVDGQSIISPDTIPMVESSDIGGVVVRFSDVEALSEEYGVDYIDSMLAIAESNDLDPQYMAVAVDESELIVNPELIYELANVVVVPQSENSLAYQFCEACLDCFIESDGDEDYLWMMIDEANQFDFKNMSDQQIRDTINMYKKRYGNDTQNMIDIGKMENELYFRNEKRQQRAANNSSTPALSLQDRLSNKRARERDEARSKVEELNAKMAGLERTNAELQDYKNRNRIDTVNHARENKKFNIDTTRPPGYKEGRFGKFKARAMDKFNDLRANAGKYAGQARDYASDKAHKSADWMQRNPGKTALGALGVAALAGGAKYLYDKHQAGKDGQLGSVQSKLNSVLQQAQGKPKSWIGKKVAALRSMYSQWLQRANAERDANRAGVFKRIAAAIMNCIDALMRKLQNFAG